MLVEAVDQVVVVFAAASPEPNERMLDRFLVIAEANRLPARIVLNKADLADPGDLAGLRTRYPGAVAVSARTGAGIEELRDRVAELLPRPTVRVEVLVPYSRGDLVSRAHATGEVIEEEHTGAGTLLTALVDQTLAAELSAAQTP